MYSWGIKVLMKQCSWLASYFRCLTTVEMTYNQLWRMLSHVAPVLICLLLLKRNQPALGIHSEVLLVFV